MRVTEVKPSSDSMVREIHKSGGEKNTTVNFKSRNYSFVIKFFIKRIYTL